MSKQFDILTQQEQGSRYGLTETGIVIAAIANMAESDPDMKVSKVSLEGVELFVKDKLITVKVK